MAGELAAARVVKGSIERAADRTGAQVAALFRKHVGDTVSPESIADFVAAALPVVRSGGNSAGSLVNSAHRRARRVAGVTGSAPRLTPPEFNAEKVETSLRFIGMVQPAREAGALIEVPFRPSDVEKVYDDIEATAARQVVQMGMDAATSAARKDPRALGWARVTQGAGACYFCSMLESRGIVYTSESFRYSDPRFETNAFPPEVMSGELTAKVHDHCRCILVPVFNRSSDIISNADAIYSVWKRVQKDYGWVRRRFGLDMIQLWRLYWEGGTERIDAYVQRNT